jgi:RNA polymerase sigma factor (sigma-70 family)
MVGVECNTLTDGELLAAFVTRQDESSFEELTRRHSTMVFNTCRRLVRVPSDAEDAAQAVFLALSMRAGDASLQSRQSLSGWLYESAVHIGLRAREAAVARSRHEREAGAMRETVVNAAAEWERVEPVLDSHLNALPEKYRLAIVLHHLEQRSVEETAGLIRCSVDAVKQRLSRGREMLKARLTRGGVALNVALLVALLDQKASTAAPPIGFISATAGRATLLASGKLAAGGAAQQSLALAKSASEAMSRTSSLRSKRAPLYAAIVLALAFIGAEAASLTRVAPVTSASTIKPIEKDKSHAKPKEIDPIKNEVDDAFEWEGMNGEKEKRAADEALKEKKSGAARAQSAASASSQPAPSRSSDF